MVPFRLPVTPAQAAVLLYHVWHCEDAENDADRTVGEIIKEIDSLNGYLSTALLESALYCCNMEAERGNFKHPLKQGFDRFLKGLLRTNYHFDKYYHQIYEKKRVDGPPKKTP